MIKVENLSKRFIISHEERERYTSLRDVIAKKSKKIFSRSQSVRTTREEFWALKELNFEIKKGDRVGIIGRNGAGKSTLLKVLSRITEPTTGRVTIDGRVASLLEVGTGFHPELTGRENIFLNGAILGMSRAEIKTKFDEIVSFAEVEQFLDTPVKRYSSGMYVRLAFAVAAHLEPEILIVDEVLAVGDAQFQKKCLGKMEDVSKNEGRTVLFVSHNMGVVSQLCSTGILLNKGEMLFHGTSLRALTEYSLLEKKSNEGYFNKHASEFVISEVKIENKEGLAYFSSEESVSVKIVVKCSSDLDGLYLGVSVLDKWKRKVFTTTNPVKKKNSTSVETFYLSFPPNLFLSGSFSVDVASFVPNGNTFSYLKDICLFEVEDYSSEMAIYGNNDVGVITVNCLWDHQ